MELNTIRPAVGSVTRSTRIGRGPGSGKGGTSTLEISKGCEKPFGLQP